MGYTFKLEKNIFMYNHLLTIINEQKSYEAMIESEIGRASCRERV